MGDFFRVFSQFFFSIYQHSWWIVDRIFDEEPRADNVYSRDEIFDAPPDRFIRRMKTHAALMLTLLQLAALLLTACIVLLIICRKYNL